MLQGQADYVFGSSVSEVVTGVDNIYAHVDRIDDCIELWEIIFFSKCPFISANTNRAHLQILIMDKFFKIAKVKLLHELLTILFPERPLKHFKRPLRELVKNLFSIERIVLFGQFYGMRKETVQSLAQSHYYFCFGLYI